MAAFSRRGREAANGPNGRHLAGSGGGRTMVRSRPMRVGTPGGRPWVHVRRPRPAARPWLRSRRPMERPGDPDRSRGPAPPARPTRRHLPAHQDVEGVHRSRVRLQARPDRTRPRTLPGPHVRLRRVRAARHPPHCGQLLGRTGPARPAPGDLQADPRRHVLPRLPIGDDTMWGVTGAARAPRTPWPRSGRSGPPVRTAPRST